MTSGGSSTPFKDIDLTDREALRAWMVRHRHDHDCGRQGPATPAEFAFRQRVRLIRSLTDEEEH